MKQIQHNETKDAIVATFIAMTEEAQSQAVTIVSLVDALGISRKTFYYYFHSLDALVEFIFRQDLALILTDNYPRKNLVFDDNDPVYREYPYYARVYGEGKHMSQTTFFVHLIDCLNQRRAFYSVFLRERRRDGLGDYLYRLYSKALREDAVFVLEGKELSDFALEFIADWIAGAFLDRLTRRLLSNKPLKTKEDIEPFGNIQHDILYLYRLSTYNEKKSRIDFPHYQD